MTESLIMKDFLVTGGNGFLGRKIVDILRNQYNVATLGSSRDNDVIADLSSNLPIASNYQCKNVIHAAGKVHINPKTAQEVESFYAINLGGTIKICKWIESWDKLPKNFVFISSVAVYGQEVGEFIDEDFSPRPTTPYACSKYWAELFLLDWAKSKGINLVILRLPLIVGQKPPGNLGAMVRAIKAGYYFRLGNGKSQRSMVNAVDIAENIESMFAFPGIYNLTDGVHPSFENIENLIAQQFQKKILKMPFFLGKLLAWVGDFIPGFPFNTYRLNKINSSLTFSDVKARKLFGWNPKPALANVSFIS